MRALNGVKCFVYYSFCSFWGVCLSTVDQLLICSSEHQDWCGKEDKSHRENWKDQAAKAKCRRCRWARPWSPGELITCWWLCNPNLSVYKRPSGFFRFSLSQRLPLQWRPPAVSPLNSARLSRTLSWTPPSGMSTRTTMTTPCSAAST